VRPRRTAALSLFCCECRRVLSTFTLHGPHLVLSVHIIIKFTRLVVHSHQHWVRTFTTALAVAEGVWLGYVAPRSQAAPVRIACCMQKSL
jgi:hypothetical protein